MKGFSLLELLVAMACGLLVGAAVLTLVVSTANAGRHVWNANAARDRATVAADALVRDLSRAGNGLEGGRAVRLFNEIIPIARSMPAGGVRLLVGSAPPAEVLAHLSPRRYRVAARRDLVAGATVAAVGMPGRPAGMPLPAGGIVAVVNGGGWLELTISWDAAAVAVLQDWGPPRGLAVFTVRDFDLRARADGLELGRRDAGGSRQPVADRLARLQLTWLIDLDGDGLPDARRASFAAADPGIALATRVRAVVAVNVGRLSGPRETAEERVDRWAALR